MITTIEFKRQIGKSFGQEMRKYGFKGTGFEYFQDIHDFLVTVYISPGRWGASCFAGFAIHPKQIAKNSSGKLNLTKLKIYQYEFKMSVENDGLHEPKWKYADNEKANLETLSDIITTITQKVFPVIDKFKTSPNLLEEFEVSEMDDFHTNWTRKTGTLIATSDVRFAWAITVVFEYKDLQKAKQFANWALLQLDEDDKDWFGYDDLERVAKK